MNQIETKRLQRYARLISELGVDVNNEQQMEAVARQFFGGDERVPDALAEQVTRHTASPPATANLIYRDGPFTWRTDELILDTTQGGSPLMQWIPMTTMEHREESVPHLSWVAPTGYQPLSGSYADFLDEQEPGECDTCLTFDWGAFEYTMLYGKACVASPKMKIEDFGMRQHEKTPVPRVRGPQAGYNLTSDAEWGIARSGIGLEQHLDWNIIYGVTGNNFQWDGIRELVTPGYIASHLVGGGAPAWANPLTFDGTGLTDCTSLAEAIKAIVRRLRKRLLDRNWRVGMTDMAIVMPYAFWHYIMDCIACGGMTGCGTQPTGYNIADWRAERARLMQGGVGFGIMEIDGIPVPVIPLSGISQDGVDGDGDYVTTGDIMVLTRRVNGMNILEQQFMNYNGAVRGWQDAAYNSWVSNGGIFKHTWISENDRCFQYTTEVVGRNVMRMAPLQAVLTSVTVKTTLPGESESGEFWAEESYYAVEGGNPLIPA